MWTNEGLLAILWGSSLDFLEHPGTSSLNAVPKFTTFELDELIYRLFLITASCSIIVAWCTSVQAYRRPRNSQPAIHETAVPRRQANTAASWQG